MRLLLIIGLIQASFSYGKDHLLEKEFQKKVFKNPLREFSIIVSEDGFYPNKMLAYTGERVRFYVTSTSKQGQCFILQKHEVFISAEKGRINEGDTLLENPGRYKFYCPANKHKGFLTVVDKSDVKEEASREIASKEVPEKPKYWTPRDYDE